MKYLTLIITLFLPIVALAALGDTEYTKYTPLVGIPGVTTGDIGSFLNTVYALSISIAALLAVIKIVVAGVKWMTTDIVTSKGDARNDIQGALFGLAIILSAVLIITVINPDIIEVDFSLTALEAPPFTLADGTVLTVTPTNYGYFEAIPITDPEAIKYGVACEEAGFQAKEDGGQMRCYITSPRNRVNRSYICQEAEFVKHGCEGPLEEKRKACEAKAGEFNIDPTSPRHFVCVAPPLGGAIQDDGTLGS